MLALALALASVFAWLGDWQLQRSRDEAAREAAARARAAEVVDLQDLMEPATAITGEAVGRAVRARGRLEPGKALLVPGRERDGEPGAWLVAPLRVQAAGDATLPVALGWLPEGAQPPALPEGTVELTGRLEQSEPPVGLEPGTTGEVPALSSADLVNLWEPPLYTGYLAVTEPVAPLRPVPESEPPSGFALQNLSYALQWWLFAAFAVFFWWRLVRDAHQRGLEGAAGEPVRTGENAFP